MSKFLHAEDKKLASYAEESAEYLNVPGNHIVAKFYSKVPPTHIRSVYITSSASVTITEHPASLADRLEALRSIFS